MAQNLAFGYMYLPNLSLIPDLIHHYILLLFFTDPPGNPKITGLDHALLSGSEHKLTCVTKAGHPPAKLNWFKGSNMMKSHYTVEGDLVKAEVSAFWKFVCTCWWCSSIVGNFLEFLKRCSLSPTFW